MSGIYPIPYNAYSSWLRIAQSAESQLIIFSPFLDEMVIHLFEECPLAWDKLGLVTQVDWEDFTAQGMNKRIILNRLTSNGVDVRYLRRLHAKAIVADWSQAVIGSQNFTYYSQDSYEVSFRLDRDEDEADLDEVFESLNNWWDLAGEDSEDDEMDGESDD
jgi:PLD-like domain